jgi:hypothetical protein
MPASKARKYLHSRNDRVHWPTYTRLLNGLVGSVGETRAIVRLLMKLNAVTDSVGERIERRLDRQERFKAAARSADALGRDDAR